MASFLFCDEDSDQCLMVYKWCYPISNISYELNVFMNNWLLFYMASWDLLNIDIYYLFPASNRLFPFVEKIWLLEVGSIQ